jgi:Plasmid pRiA4b ORF-3-like protein
VGDELLYVYDYGDEWELRIRLESVVDRAPGAVRAVCTGGRRGAPPENCGGIYAYDDAVTEPGVEQADAFDADAVNEVLEATQRLSASVSDRPDLLVTMLHRTVGWPGGSTPAPTWRSRRR